MNELSGKINILYIIDVMVGIKGGTEGHLYRLIKKLDPRRFSCSIVSFSIDDELKKSLRDEGICIYHVPINNIIRFQALKNAFVLRRIIKDNRIDIVQTFHFKSDTYGVFVSKISGVRHILSSRRDTGDTKKKSHILLNRLMDSFIERFITVCNTVGDRLEADEGVSMSRRTTIYNGVDFNEFTVPEKNRILQSRRRLGIAEGDFVVGTIAYFRPEKNYDVFFKAMALIKRAIKNLRIITVGSGETFNDCNEFCREIGLEDSVIHAGMVDDVKDYVSVMDVACLIPGSNEGFSNAILEKMAMGKPLIVTDVGGNAEAVINNENGIVIAPYDVDGMVKAVLYLHDNPSVRAEMGKRCRQRIEQHFPMKKMISDHEKIYVDIMNGLYK